MNEKVRCRDGATGKIRDKVDWKVLMCLEYVGPMSGERLTKKVYESEAEGRRDRGR